MDYLDISVIEASGVAHQIEHKNPVERQQAQQCEGAAV